MANLAIFSPDYGDLYKNSSSVGADVMSGIAQGLTNAARDYRNQKSIERAAEKYGDLAGDPAYGEILKEMGMAEMRAGGDPAASLSKVLASSLDLLEAKAKNEGSLGFLRKSEQIKDEFDAKGDERTHGYFKEERRIMDEAANKRFEQYQSLNTQKAKSGQEYLKAADEVYSKGRTQKNKQTLAVLDKMAKDNKESAEFKQANALERIAANKVRTSSGDEMGVEDVLGTVYGNLDDGFLDLAKEKAKELRRLFPTDTDVRKAMSDIEDALEKRQEDFEEKYADFLEFGATPREEKPTGVTEAEKSVLDKYSGIKSAMESKPEEKEGGGLVDIMRGILGKLKNETSDPNIPEEPPTEDQKKNKG